MPGLMINCRFPWVSCFRRIEIVAGGSARMRCSCWGVACLFLLSCTSAIAQTIVEGTVHDNSGRALANATVSLGHPDAAIVQTTSTDIEGKFRISAVEAGAYRLRVQAGGYYAS